MGQKGSIEVETPQFVPMPKVKEFLQKNEIDLKSVKEWKSLQKTLADLCNDDDEDDLDRYDFDSLQGAIDQLGEKHFFEKTLPFMFSVLERSDEVFSERNVQFLPQKKNAKVMFLNYFERMRQRMSEESFCPTDPKITIERRYLPKNVGVLNEKNSKVGMGNVSVFHEGSIFDSKDSRHADFANMFIGGGVIGTGCVQEEIAFAVYPECCVSMLICPCMTPDEAIVITGAEKFSVCKGYAFGMKFGGDFVDPKRGKGSEMVAIDALDFRGDNPIRQWGQEKIDREIRKAFIGFGGSSMKKVATGNWGCGAFLADKYLKFVIQWIACTLQEQDPPIHMEYFTFETKPGTKPVLALEIRRFVKLLREKKTSVGELYWTVASVGEYCEKNDISLRNVNCLRIVEKLLFEKDQKIDPEDIRKDKEYDDY